MLITKDQEERSQLNHLQLKTNFNVRTKGTIQIRTR